MAARSDDDVSDTPGGQKLGGQKAGDGVIRDKDDDAGDTTAALRKPPPATTATADDASDDIRTVRRKLDTKVLQAERARATQPLGGVQPRDTKPAAIRMTSKKATAQGLGVPLPLSRRTASVPPPAPLPPPKKTNEADEADDSITATAPALVAPTAASIVPTGAGVGAVKISQVEEEGEGDETEVRTVVGLLRGELPRRPVPGPAAGRPPTPTPAPPPDDDDGAEAIDDSVTAQAPSLANLPADDEPKTQPPILSPAALPALKGRAPVKSVDMYESDESVTSRAPAIGDYDDDDDDSVTADRPAIGNGRKSSPALGPARLVDDEDDHPHNQTAVMMNAPVKPPDRSPLFTTTPMAISPMSGRALAAPRDPSSESGLQIAPTVRNEGADHASVAVLLAGMPQPQRFSETDGDLRLAPAFSPLDPSALQHADPLAQPKKPNYGLIVGVTAGLSVLIPLVLYFALRGGAVPAEPRTPAAVEPDPVGTSDVARPRATRPPPTAQPTSTTKRTWWKR